MGGARSGAICGMCGQCAPDQNSEVREVKLLDDVIPDR
jgi:hypothetical protein